MFKVALKLSAYDKVLENKESKLALDDVQLVPKKLRTMPNPSHKVSENTVRGSVLKPRAINPTSNAPSSNVKPNAKGKAQQLLKMLKL